MRRAWLFGEKISPKRCEPKHVCGVRRLIGVRMRNQIRDEQMDGHQGAKTVGEML
jgi:hypothetical protein